MDVEPASAAPSVQPLTTPAADSTPSSAVTPPTVAVPVDDKAARPKFARIEGLDGVRGLGCLAVIVGHVTHFYSPHTHQEAMLQLLGIALILFFALSGFLLFLPYLRRLMADKSKLRMPDTRDFALHRIFRVFPGFLVIFLICNYVFRAVYVVNPATIKEGTDVGSGMITDPGQLIANLTLTQTYFPQYIQTGINPAWSLTLEIAFYVSLPLLGFLLFWLRRRTSLQPLLIACVAPAILFTLGIVGRLLAPPIMASAHVTTTELLNWGPNWSAVYLRCFLSNADMFAYGMLAAIMFVAVEQQVVGPQVRRWARTVCAVALIPGFVVVMFSGPTVFFTSAVAAFSALFIYVVIGPLALHKDSRLARIMDYKPFWYVGLVSLSAYLWHYPVILLLGRYGWAGGDTWGGMLWNTFITLAVTMTLATITYYLVEKPALASVKRFTPRKK